VPRSRSFFIAFTKYPHPQGENIVSTPHQSLNLPKELPNGLILRLATEKDIPALCELNGKIHEPDLPLPNIISLWTDNLLRGQHPTTNVQDFIVVEDPHAEGKIVSVTGLIPQTWRYGEVEFAVGRPELVATLKDYRRRGLTRAIFNEIHALSHAYGHQMQVITGIEWFYRQFDYEYAMPLGGSQHLYLSDVPNLKDEQSEPFEIRPATPADAPTLARLHRQQWARAQVAALYDEAYFRYLLTEVHAGSIFKYLHYCLLNAAGEVVGFYSHTPHLDKGILYLNAICLDPSINQTEALGNISRAIKAYGKAQAAKDEKADFAKIIFGLGVEHPAYRALKAHLKPGGKPYGLYVRVADVPGFLRHIRPVLEARLAESEMQGYSGTLNITFYRGGVQLVFEKGRISKIDSWQAPETDESWQGAGFPPHTFLHLLFGNRSLAQLTDFFADCFANPEAEAVLNALFPPGLAFSEPVA
jgi:GNAT superfamily N-acetyltransferase